ncbi:O-antigen ligase family protein [bacterium]|jgi:O-antigen ligase|nr:O-antigen ligase family protein [bacterium]
MSVFGINIGESLWGGFERMEGMFYYVYLALFLLVLLQVLYNDQRWKNVFLSITVANILISALAILQKFNITLGIIDYAGRIGGTLGNAAYLASVLLVSSIFLVFFFYKYKAYRLLTGITLGLNLIAIFISATRGTLLALGLVVFLALIVSLLKKNFLSSKNKKIALSLIFLFLISTASLFIFKDSSVIKNNEALHRISTISLSDTTSQSRIIVWGYSLKAFADRPLSGWGLENFDDAFNVYFDNTLVEEWFDRAHNNYFDILVTGGVFALLLYIIFIVAVFKNIYSLYKRKRIDFLSWQIFTFGWLAYLIQNIFIFDSLNTLIYLLFFIALLYHLNRQDNDVVYIKKIRSVPIISSVFAIVILSLVFFTIIVPVKANKNFILAFNSSNNVDFEVLADQSLQYDYLALPNEEMSIYFSDLVRSQVSKGNTSNLDWIIKNLEDKRSTDIKILLNLSYFYTQKYYLTDDENILSLSIAMLEDLSQKNQSRYLVFEQLGKTYTLLEDKELAEKNLKISFELKGNEKSLWNLLNMYIRFDDQYTLRHYTRILLDGEFSLLSSSMNNLIQYFNNIGDYEMLELILLELNSESQSADVLADLAVIKLKLGKTDEAQNYAEQAIKLDIGLHDSLRQFFSF